MSGIIREASQIRAQLDRIADLEGDLSHGARLALQWLLDGSAPPPQDFCAYETSTGSARQKTAAEEAAELAEPQGDDVSAERQGDLFEHFGADREGPKPINLDDVED